MFCPKCGSKVNDDAKFCASCGASLEAAAEADQTVSAGEEEAIQVLAH